MGISAVDASCLLLGKSHPRNKGYVACILAGSLGSAYRQYDRIDYFGFIQLGDHYLYRDSAAADTDDGPERSHVLFRQAERTISRPDKVPLVAELMPTRWSYEALMVSQFKDNRYSSLVYTADGETFYSLQKKISQADFNSVHRIPELREVLRDAAEKHDNPEKIKSLGNDLSLIRKELAKIPLSSDMVQFDGIDALYPGKFNNDVTGSLDEYFDELSSIFNKQIIEAERIKDEFVSLNREKLKALEKDYYNYKLEEIITRYYDPDKIIKFKNSLIQKPILFISIRPRRDF